MERVFRCPGVPNGFVVYFAYGSRRRLVTDPNYARDADSAAAQQRTSERSESGA
jgi:hypothetical protein